MNDLLVQEILHEKFVQIVNPGKFVKFMSYKRNRKKFTDKLKSDLQWPLRSEIISYKSSLINIKFTYNDL